MGEGEGEREREPSNFLRAMLFNLLKGRMLTTDGKTSRRLRRRWVVDGVGQRWGRTPRCTAVTAVVTAVLFRWDACKRVARCTRISWIHIDCRRFSRISWAHQRVLWTVRVRHPLMSAPFGSSVAEPYLRWHWEIKEIVIIINLMTVCLKTN